MRILARPMIGLALVFMSAMAVAQVATKAPASRIGVLLVGSPSTSTRYVEVLRESLRDYGLIDGKNVSIEPRFASGDYERLPALANELVDVNVNLIVAGSEQALLAAKKAKRPVPIVVVACNPLEKLVGSLSRPGGNATGVTCVSSDLVGKRFSYLKAIVPNARRVAILYHGEEEASSELVGAESAGRTLGMEVMRFPVRSPSDFAPTFEKMMRENCRALYVSSSGFTNFHRQRLVDLALNHRLPAIFSSPEFVEVGGLVSYGATLSDSFKRAAYFVDRILKGTSPKDLPVEEPTKFYLVLNAKTAAVLSIKIPEDVLLQAHTIIK